MWLSGRLSFGCISDQQKCTDKGNSYWFPERGITWFGNLKNISMNVVILWFRYD